MIQARFMKFRPPLRTQVPFANPFFWWSILSMYWLGFYVPPFLSKFGILSTKGNITASVFSISIRASLSYWLLGILSTKKTSLNSYFFGLKGSVRLFARAATFWHHASDVVSSTSAPLQGLATNCWVDELCQWVRVMVYILTQWLDQRWPKYCDISWDVW